jgi:DtxR family Mn-dependent transcriptional regulator
MIDPLVALLTALLLAVAGLALFWPRRGLLQQWSQMRRLSSRVLTEDALKHIYKYERTGRRPTLESLAGALQISVNQATEILERMQASQLLVVVGDLFKLTPQGREYALRIIRAHRVWERFLADETGFVEADWHDQAEAWEHRLSPEETEALFVQLGYPTHDPHGDPIPTAQGEYVPHGGVPLSSVDPDAPVRIVHIEDEPEAIYAQLVAEGLHLGMELRVFETTLQRVQFWANGDEHLLAPIVAANVSVVPVEEPAARPTPSGERLSGLQPGQSGRVIGLSAGLRGQERRRLMDLGILPGTEIQALFGNPAGDPVAYKVRGATIALRRDQSDLIQISSTDQKQTGK